MTIARIRFLLGNTNDGFIDCRSLQATRCKWTKQVEINQCNNIISHSCLVLQVDVHHHSSYPFWQSYPFILHYIERFEAFKVILWEWNSSHNGKSFIKPHAPCSLAYLAPFSQLPKTPCGGLEFWQNHFEIIYKKPWLALLKHLGPITCCYHHLLIDSSVFYHMHGGHILSCICHIMYSPCCLVGPYHLSLSPCDLCTF